MFREILDRALKRDAEKSDIAQLVVLINYKPMFCDYANFSKYDPDFWFNLADEVHTNSANPEMSLGLFAIAASQYFFDGPYSSTSKTKESLMRGMALKEHHPVLMTIGKAAMLQDMGALEELPKREEIAQEGLQSAIKHIELFEKILADELA
jgi:hypothetical protein